MFPFRLNMVFTLLTWKYFTEKSRYLHRKAPVLGSLFDKVMACNFMKKRHGRRCFTEFLGTFSKKLFHRALMNDCSSNSNTCFCITDDKYVVCSFRRITKNIIIVFYWQFVDVDVYLISVFRILDIFNSVTIRSCVAC